MYSHGGMGCSNRSLNHCFLIPEIVNRVIIVLNGVPRPDESLTADYHKMVYWFYFITSRQLRLRLEQFGP